MTRKELKQEAEEWLNKWELCNKCDHKVECIEDNAFCLPVVKRAYLAGAEPREKQIQIDAEQIRALQKQNGELTDELTKKSDTNHQLVEQLAKLNERCSELEAQIEKMRNCANCKNYNGNEGFCVLGSGYGYNCNLKKWEIKEK